MRFDPVEYDEKGIPPSIYWPGIDKGGGRSRFPIAVTRVDPGDPDHRWIAVRIPAHRYWAGQFSPQAYAPASIEVWELRKRDGWEGRRVMDIPVREKSQR